MMLLNNQWVTKETKRKSKIIDKWKWKHSNPKPIGPSERSSKWEVIAIKSYLRQQEKAQISNLSLHLKQLEKEQTKHS